MWRRRARGRHSWRKLHLPCSNRTCVFDIGANAGQYATMLRTRVGYRGPIVSYEPIPELASKIRSAAALGHVWFVEGLALDATEGQATLNIFASDQFRSLHSVSAAAEREFHKQVKLERRIEVRTGIAACEGVRQNPREASKRPFLNMPSAPESGCATS